MEYFPHQNLGIFNILFIVMFVMFVILNSTLLFFIWKKYANKIKRKILKCILGMIYAIFISLLMYIDNGFIFSKIHFYFNKTLPNYTKCLNYRATGVELKAKFIVSNEAFKNWINKYKLKEIEIIDVSTRFECIKLDYENFKLILKDGMTKKDIQAFSSKFRMNGQGLFALYDNKKSILKISYSAF